MDSYWLEIILILVLILANGFFAAAEISLISARKTRIRELAKKGIKRAKIVQSLQAEPSRFLATVQVGITLVGTLASVVGGAKIVDALIPLLNKIPITGIEKASETIAIGLVVVAISYLSLVIGELVPKNLAIQSPERMAMHVSTSVNWIGKFFSFIIKILAVSSKSIAALIIRRTPSENPFFTEEEIKYIITEGKEKGVFEPTEEEFIHSIFEFTDTRVKHAMTPAPEIVAIDIHSDREKLLRTVTEEGFSRFPVYEHNLDNIVGVIHTKDIINILENKELIILNDIIRKTIFVSPSQKISSVLKDFQKNRIHMAIAQDDNKKTVGLITLEDIIEEIVGEIHDEYDEELREIDILTNGQALVNAAMKVSEFNLRMKTSLPEGKFDTLSGLIINTLGRVPAREENFDLFGINFTVFEKTGHRLHRLKVNKVSSSHN